MSNKIPLLVKRRSMGGHEKAGYGETNEWYTPPHIFTSLGLDFDLDPASPLDGPVSWIPAKRFLSAQEDGLHTAWEGKVWLNPPYGADMGKWVAKLAAHGNGVALLFARTDTVWFHKYGVRANIICFLNGRLTFFPGSKQKITSNAGAPSMLLGFGDECSDAVRTCGLGAVMRFDVLTLTNEQPALMRDSILENVNEV